MTMKLRCICAVVILIFSALSYISAHAQDSKDKRMPKEEVEKLMNEVLPFAQKMLAAHGEFFPYGGYIDSKGKTVFTGASDGTEKPPAAQLIQLMTEAFKVQAKSG